MNESGSKVAWNFGDPVTDDMTLTAVWSKNNNGGGGNNNDGNRNGKTSPDTGDSHDPILPMLLILAAAGTALTAVRQEYKKTKE